MSYPTIPRSRLLNESEPKATPPFTPSLIRALAPKANDFSAKAAEKCPNAEE